MIQVIKYGLFLTLSCVLLDQGIGLLLDNIYKQNKIGEAGGKLNYYLDDIDSTDILILGSSRGLSHIIPDSFGNRCFNLSHHGMKVPFNAGVVQILNVKNKLPNFLILHIELPSFAFYIGNDIDKSETAFLRYYYHQIPKIREYIDEISPFEKIKYLSKLYRYNGTIPSMLSNYIRSQKSPPTDNGFEITYPSLKDSARIEKQVQLQLKRVRPSKELLISKQSLKYLDDIISICNQKEVNLVIVSSPKYQPKTPGEELAANFLEKYLEKEKILFLDYGDNQIQELQKLKYWRDFEHMHIKGAEVFTKNLKKDLLDTSK